jgi:putative FmdB family regulatory protein
MPTYEYKCVACGFEFERFQSIKAAPVKKCPECGKSKVKRLIGMGAGLLFKGSGFYITDYRGESYNKAAKADAAPTSGGESKPSTDTSSTPVAPKAESTTPAKSESAPAAPKTESKKSSRPPKK